MKKNNNGNISIIAIILTFVIGLIGFTGLYSSLGLNKNISNSKLSSKSQMTLLNQINNSDNNDLNIEQKETSLNEGEEITFSISKDKISTGDKVVMEFNNNGLASIHYNEDILNKKQNQDTYDFNGGFIIKDASFWNNVETNSNYELQKSLIKNNQLKDLLNFLQLNVSKIGKIGSYILFDFGDKVLINNFSIKLTSKTLNSNRDIPEIISITLDNGISYYYQIEDIKENQRFIFEDTYTRYLKLDVVKTKNSTFNTNNQVVADNIERDLIIDEILITENSPNKISVSIPTLSSLNGVLFYNVYIRNGLTRNNNIFISKLKSETNFDINKGENSNITGIGIEICSDINKCKTIVKKGL